MKIINPFIDDIHLKDGLVGEWLLNGVTTPSVGPVSISRGSAVSFASGGLQGMQCLETIGATASSNKIITIPSTSEFAIGHNSFSYEWWYKGPSGNGKRMFGNSLNNIPDANGVHYVLCNNPSSNTSYLWGDSAGTIRTGSAVNGLNIDDGQWHQFVVSYDYDQSPRRLRLYIDGVIGNINDTGGGNIRPTVLPRAIMLNGTGKYDATQQVTEGKWSIVRIWKGVALEEDAVIALFNNRNGLTSLDGIYV